MIKTIADLVAVELTAKGCPLPIVYGPEPSTTIAIVAPRIVIQRAGEDAVGPPRSQHRLPRQFGIRAISAVARVFSQATLDGANVWDHERLADAAMDLVQVALEKVCRTRKMPIAFGSAHFLSPEELQMRGLLVPHGVVYELQFHVDRGVLDRNWAGFGPSTTEFPGVTNVTNVKIRGSQDPPETGCGG